MSKIFTNNDNKSNDNLYYENKYLKYKKKYNELKIELEGAGPYVPILKEKSLLYQDKGRGKGHDVSIRKEQSLFSQDKGRGKGHDKKEYTSILKSTNKPFSTVLKKKKKLTEEELNNYLNKHIPDKYNVYTFFKDDQNKLSPRIVGSINPQSGVIKNKFSRKKHLIYYFINNTILKFMSLYNGHSNSCSIPLWPPKSASYYVSRPVSKSESASKSTSVPYNFCFNFQIENTFVEIRIIYRHIYLDYTIYYIVIKINNVDPIFLVYFSKIDRTKKFKFPPWHQNAGQEYDFFYDKKETDYQSIFDDTNDNEYGALFKYKIKNINDFQFHYKLFNFYATKDIKYQDTVFFNESYIFHFKTDDRYTLKPQFVFFKNV